LKKIRILVTTSTFPRYENDSCPRFVLDLCKSIEALGRATTLVLAPYSEGSMTFDILEGVKVKRYRYVYPDSLAQISGQGIVAKLKKNKFLFLLVPLFFFFQTLSTLITVINYKPQVLIANWIIPQGLVGAFLKRLFFPNLKTVLISRGGDLALIQKNFFLRKLGGIVLNEFHRIVTVSNSIKNKLIEMYHFDEDEIRVIPSGVDINRFEQSRVIHEKNKKEKILLWTGRIEEKKGIDYLLKAMKYVVEKHPSAVLKIVGDGTKKEDFINLAAGLGLKGNVIFTGSLPSSMMPSCYGEALVFVAPCIDLKDDVEGLPNVIVEAIAAKVPVITTDAGGITDIIEDNVTGILVPQKSIKELADKIIELIERPELRKFLVHRAFNKLNDGFTHPAVGKKHQEIIDSLLESY